MRINHRISFAVIGIAFIVVSVVLLNMAFAATSSVQVNNNTMDADVRSVDITLDDGTALTAPLEITPPDYATVTDPEGVHYIDITGHKLSVTASDDVSVRTWITLSSTSSWIIVQSATITINGHDYAFAVANGGAGVPTDAFSLPQGSYSFTIRITFTAQYDADYNSIITHETMSETMYNALKAAFSGQLVFAIDDGDPLSPIQAQNP